MATVELWAQDEARLGLIPIVRRIWAPRGSRPRALGRRRYQWLYLFGFVHPSSGQVFWLLMPTVNAAVFTLALAQFAKAVDAGAHRRILLVVDGAGWHKSKELVIPDGLELVFLPPYSPELQPSERLWPLIREPLANRVFENLAELDHHVGVRCGQLQEQQPLLRGHTRYHWWPADRTPSATGQPAASAA